MDVLALYNTSQLLIFAPFMFHIAPCYRDSSYRGISYGPVSVRPSITSRYCIETSERIELVLAQRLPSTYPTLVYTEFYTCYPSSLHQPYTEFGYLQK